MLVFLSSTLLKFTSITVVVIAVLVVLVLLFVFIVLSGYVNKKEWEQSKYVISSDKVTIIAQNKQKTYGMRGCTSMRLDKSFLQRICKSGKITLFFMGGGNVELNNIEEPEIILHKIEKMTMKS